jgi:hypothetical protein
VRLCDLFFAEGAVFFFALLVPGPEVLDFFEAEEGEIFVFDDGAGSRMFRAVDEP